MILCLSLLLVFCSGCSASSPLDFMERVQSTNLSEETGGLKVLNSSEQDVIEQWGEPRHRMDVQQESKLKGDEVVLEYNNYQYVLEGGHVVSYSLRPGQTTAKQLKIGDEEARIVELYGENYYSREQDNMHLKGYLDKENERVIEFVIDQQKVAMVIVSELSMFTQ